ncbi:MAG: tetratricopeptide repeat protein [Rhizobiaceae bacterium]
MRSIRLLRKSVALSLVLGVAVAVSSCATDPRTTGSVRGSGSNAVAQMSVPQLNAQLRKYAESYNNNQKDKRIGLTYASLLRMTGKDEQALAVVRKLVIHHPEDNQILTAYAKALAATGNLKQALAAIEKAQRPEQPDWQLLSAQGAILDQLDRSNDARIHYRQALDIVPNEPTVLSNLGMSYVLSNDLPAAETYLRKANSQPGADSRVRQNLALVVGLQGRFVEAQQIASAELPESEARANIAYLRDMLSQQNSWSMLEKEDKKVN